MKADRFEHAFDELGRTLGFSTQRPDKEWKEGPDNLWAVRDGEYLLVECKSEVHVDRNHQGRDRSDAKAKNIMIIPAGKLANGADFTELGGLTENVRSFFAGRTP